MKHIFYPAKIFSQLLALFMNYGAPKWGQEIVTYAVVRSTQQYAAAAVRSRTLIV
jgi:hypothetical protein